MYRNQKKIMDTEQSENVDNELVQINTRNLYAIDERLDSLEKFM